MAEMVLPADEEEQRDSMLGSLKRDRMQESITQAGRRLARSLGERTYADEPADRFFVQCYRLRSELVHGNDPLPPIDEIRRRTPALRQFVRDLLSINFLDAGKQSD